MDSYNSQTTKPIFRATQILWYIFGVLEVLLMFRFFLKLFAGNPNAGFTEFVYSISSPLVAPFISVFRVSQVEGNVFEWTTLLAMFVYWLIALGITELLLMSKSVSTKEAAIKLNEQEGV